MLDLKDINNKDMVVCYKCESPLELLGDRYKFNCDCYSSRGYNHLKWCNVCNSLTGHKGVSVHSLCIRCAFKPTSKICLVSNCEELTMAESTQNFKFSKKYCEEHAIKGLYVKCDFEGCNTNFYVLASKENLDHYCKEHFLSKWFNKSK